MTDPQTTSSRRYFVRLIWSVLLLSVLGNAVHAVPEIAGTTGARVLIAVLPPILLAALVHGLGHLANAGVGGRLYAFGVVSVGVLALAAATASFSALRDLATTAGWSPGLAWLLPVIIDTPVPIATAVLVAIDRAAMRRPDTAVVAHQGDAEPAVAQGGEVEGDVAALSQPASKPSTAVELPKQPPAEVEDVTVDAPQPQPRRAPVSQGDANPATEVRVAKATPAPAPSASTADAEEVRRLATLLVNEGRTTADLDTVAEVLSRSAAGQSGRSISAAVGLSEPSVRRIRKAAQELTPVPA